METAVWGGRRANNNGRAVGSGNRQAGGVRRRMVCGAQAYSNPGTGVTKQVGARKPAS